MNGQNGRLHGIAYYLTYLDKNGYDMDIIDDVLRTFMAYPRYGEIKRYRVISEEDYDITPKESLLKRLIENTESQIDTQKRLRQKAVEEYDRRIAELEEELQKQKKRLKP